MIPSFEGTSFGSFEGGDAPWMIPSSEGTSFSGSDLGEEETETTEAASSGAEETASSEVTE